MIVDLTGVACSVLAGVITLLSAIVPAFVNSHFKDKQAAAVLGDAVRNSLGALQQSGTVLAQTLAPRLNVPGVPERLQPAVQYVLDQAGAEAQRLGVSPEKIASKVLAQVGLGQIDVNKAVAGNASPDVPDPLGPVRVVQPVVPPLARVP